MQMHISTTPVGRRPMTHAVLSALEKAVPAKEGRSIDKWTAYEAIKACHREIGISSRSLTVLYAMISFVPDKELTDRESLIVWPSNASLCNRCHAISEATLRRAIAELVETGIIVRRDSPNGKRYARRGEGGQLQRAFGFDLTPVITRHAEFADRARMARSLQQTLLARREELSILRREIIKMLEFCEAEGTEIDVEKLKTLYFARTRDLSRKMTLDTIEATIASLRPILEEISNSLNSMHNVQNMTASALQNERHIESSNPESEKKRNKIYPEKEKKTAPTPELSELFTPAALEFIDRRCKQIKIVSGVASIRSWIQFCNLAQSASKAIGVREALWKSLVTKFTSLGAATLIAFVYEGLEKISAPFAYLAKLLEDTRPAAEVIRQMMTKVIPQDA